MKNIWVIFKREYLSRVKNKTFIIMTFLGPVLMVGFYASTLYIATKGSDDKRIKNVYVSQMIPFINDTLLSHEVANNSNKAKKNGTESGLLNTLLILAPSNKDSAIEHVKRGSVDGWLSIGDYDFSTLDSTNYYTLQTPSMIEMEILNKWIQDRAVQNAYSKLGLRESQIDSLRSQGSIKTKELSKDGNISDSSSDLKSGIGLGLAFLVYLFIFIYGSMVMRSAMEEKTNRIVEIIVSSVKPFHLMMGKILGVAAVGLTQFIAWIVLAIALISGISSFGIGQQKIEPTSMVNVPGAMGNSLSAQQIETIQSTGDAHSLLALLENLPYFQILAIFLLFFIGGYLLYSSFFAAIGSAVNESSDVQQFMLPVSLPLVFGFIIAQSVALKSPHGILAKVFSMFPLTSPVVMVVRAPFGVPISEIILSACILFASFFLMVWVSGRIYRIGILSYGKKPTWKDLWKWIR
ncbi:MAG: ABC transporter permease [Flavobacteriaceae bacterium]|nr:ABC transporter permease [Flavobacteriaceae bacterium]